MFSFKEYLIERGPIPSRGTLSSKVESKQGKSHYTKYYGPEAMDRHGNDWTLSADHKKSGLQAGDIVRLNGVKKVGGDWHGIHHDDAGNEHSIPMSKFYKPTGGRVGKDQEAAEADQMKTIQDNIDKAKGSSPYMRLHVGGGKFVNVAGATRVTKEIANQYGHRGAKPKADMFLHDEHGRPVSWHSLKASGGFQQLGGLQDHEVNGKDHPVLDKIAGMFRKHKTNQGYDTVPEGLMYHHDLDDNDPEHRKIVHRAMYGKDHGKDYGVNNVNSVVQGTMHFMPAAVSDSEGRNHKGIPAMDLHPLTHQHMNTNDDNSEMIPSKVVVRRDRETDQKGSGGRMMIIAKNNHNYRNSIPVTSSQGVKKDLFNHAKKLEADAVARKQQREQEKQQRLAAKKAAPPPAIDMPPAPAANRSKKVNQPITSEGHGQHGGSDFYGPSEKSQ